MKVFGVVGLPASGKGEFSKIAAELGIPVVVMGDVIRNAVKDAGLAPTDANLGATANRLRAEHGMDAIAILCVDLIKKQDAPLVLVRRDTRGCRGQGLPPVLSRASGWSLSRPRLRYVLERLRERKRSDDVGSAEGLKTRDEREKGWGLERALAMADVRINNDGTLEEFTKKVTGFVRALEQEP